MPKPPVPLFYINLASRPDRRERMEQQFERLGIAAERFDAIIPATSDPKWVALAQSRVSPTELACTLSHRAIWRLIVDRGLDAALILEDDMLLAPALATLAEGWGRSDVDILRFETRYRTITLGRSIHLPNGVSARQMLSHEIGTGGYLITRGLVPKLIDDPRLAELAIDKFLFGREGPCLRRDRIFATCPALALPTYLCAEAGDEATRSDIDPERVTRSAAPRPRSLRTRLARMRANLTHAGLEIAHATRSGALGSLTRQSIPFAGTGQK